MTAAHDKRSIPGGVHVLEANRTVLFEKLLLALVAALHCQGQAGVACVAVEEVVSPAYSTNSALLAVKNSLADCVVVEQVAHRAEVDCELDGAPLACLLGLLREEALETADGGDLVSVEFVRLLDVLGPLELLFVVAETAGEELQALRALLLALASVVLAPFFVHLHFHFLFLLLLQLFSRLILSLLVFFPLFQVFFLLLLLHCFLNCFWLVFLLLLFFLYLLFHFLLLVLLLLVQRFLQALHVSHFLHKINY